MKGIRRCMLFVMLLLSGSAVRAAEYIYTDENGNKYTCEVEGEALTRLSVSKRGVVDLAAMQKAKGISITSIGGNDGALGTSGVVEYADKSKITGLRLPASVGEICSCAFTECSSIKEIDFGENSELTSIGRGAFSPGFSEGVLKSVILPKGCASIGDYAFPGETVLLVYDGSVAHEYVKEGSDWSFQILVESLEITTPPVQEYDYDTWGENRLNTDGIVLTIQPEGGQQQRVLTDSELANIQYSAFDIKQVGKQTIKVSYGGQEAEFDVTVFYPVSDVGVDILVEGKSFYSCTYTGAEIKPAVEVKNRNNSNAVIDPENYTVAYTQNINAGEAKVTVTGKKEAYFKGSCEKTFRIDKASLSSVTALFEEAHPVYNSLQQKPDPVLKLGDYTLQKGTDYTLDRWGQNVNASEGKAFVIVEVPNGAQNFQGEQTFYFTIDPKPLTKEMVAAIPNQVYTGKECTLSKEDLLVSFEPDETEKVTLAEGKTRDYTVTYTDNTAIGTAKAKIKAADGSNYTGEVEVTFQIVPIPLKEEMITIADPEYTGDPIAVSPVINAGVPLEAGTDYDLSYDQDYTEPGEAFVTITGKGHLSGTVKKTFTIQKADLSKAVITDIAPQIADGKAKTPKIGGVTLGGKTVPEDSYTVAYQDNTNAGTAAAVLTAKENSNYQGTVSKTFMIKGLSLNAGASGADDITFDISLEEEKKAYDGKESKPVVIVKMVTALSDEDGAATVGSSDQTGTDAGENDPETDEDGEENGSETGATGNDSNEIGAQDALGKNTEETILKEGTDYTVTFGAESIKKPGKYQVTVKGVGMYEGSRELTYTITKQDVGELMLLPIRDQVYTGKALRPDVTVKMGDTELVNGVDYKVTYISNTDLGKAGVVIEGQGDCYEGELRGNFNIIDAEDVVPDPATTEEDKTGGQSIEEGSTGSTTGEGKAGDKSSEEGTSGGSDKSTEEETSGGSDKSTEEGTSGGSDKSTEEGTSGGSDKSSEEGTSGGSDKSSEEGTSGGTGGDKNTEEGTGSAGTTGEGKSGSKTTEIPSSQTSQGTSQAPQTSTTEQTGKTAAATEAGADSVTAPQKAKISKVTNKASKKLVVKWKKISDTAGYEVSIATKKSFKSGKKTKNVSKTTYTFSKLKKGKTYFVRVRAYRKDSSGKKVYGAYSKVKKIKISK